MKKVLFSVILICVAFVAKSEEFKPFRVDVGLGYAMPKGGGGVLFSIEPKYAFAPNIMAGFRAEWAGMARVRWTADAQGHTIDSGETEAKFTGSYLVTGDYHFTTDKFRPFAGLGVGLYTLAGAAILYNSDITTNINAGSKNNFGLMLRAGFDVAHCRLAVEYNFTGKDHMDKSCNYLGIKFSAYIGGGIKYIVVTH